MSSKAELCSRKPRARLLPTKPQTPESRIFIPKRSSLATGFYRGDLGQICRKIIGREVFHIHFNQTNKGTAKIRPFPTAAVDDNTNSHYSAAFGMDDIDGFLDSTPTCDHIFSHNEPFARR